MPKSTSLSALLRFITGTSSVPPMGLKTPIELCYFTQSSGRRLPGSSACANKVFLPTCHCSKDDFFADFIKAIEFGGTGFGRP